MIEHKVRHLLTCKRRLMPQQNTSLWLLDVVPVLLTLQKSTLCGGFRIQVSGLTGHTIPRISEDLTAKRHATPDPSHLDPAASQRDVSVLSGQSTMGYTRLKLLSEPPAWGRYLKHLFSLLWKRKLIQSVSCQPWLQALKFCPRCHTSVWFVGWWHVNNHNWWWQHGGAHKQCSN